MAQKPVEEVQEIAENGMEASQDDGISTQQQHVKKPRNWCSNVMENNFGVLVVSQFTLFGKLKGNKPDFHDAMNGEDALTLFNHFVETMRADYIPERVQIGAFGQYMHIDMEGDGPVTLVLEEEDKVNI